MIDIEEHMPLLQDMASDKHVVELGVRDGSGSTTAFLRGAKKLTSYDITPLRPKHLAKLDTGDTDWEFIVGDSLEIEVPECDLLFIDTYHVADHLTKELNLHASKAMKYIIFHDTNTFWESGEVSYNDVKDIHVDNSKGLKYAIEPYIKCL